MKFLLLVKPRLNAPELPHHIDVMKAAKEYLHRETADGVIDCVYQFANGQQAVAIVNAHSVEELWETLSAYPLYPVQDYEIHPLADINFLFEKYLERMESKVPA